MWVIEALVPDWLWERIAPVPPPPKPRRHRYPGSRPVDDRAALAGIVFVLKTGDHLEPVAHGAGRLLRGDLLAAAAGVDRGRPLAVPARAAAGPAARSASWTWIGARSRLPHSRTQRGGHVGPSPSTAARPAPSTT